jgi:sugar diacid utilization regulator
MLLDSDFLQLLISRNVPKEVKVFISDASNTLIAATQMNDIDSYHSFSTYILKNKTPLVLETPSSTLNNVYGLPLYSDSNLIGSIILEGEKEIIKQIGNTIKVQIEALTVYLNYSGTNAGKNTKEKQKDLLVYQLISDDYQEEQILSAFNRLEIDPSLMHSVIYIRYTFDNANYFNINLNLGYQSEIENTKNKINELLESVKYFNSQDLIGHIGQNGTLIIKSYIPTDDICDVYAANQKICIEIKEKLEKITSLDFHIASGDVYLELQNISKSYQEAMNILDIARHYKKKERLLTLKSILLEDTYHYLDSYIKNKLVHTLLNKIKEDNPNHYEELLKVIDTYIECGFSISETSKLTQMHRNTVNNKLVYFKNLTGLDVSDNFSEAFLLKMIIIHNEQNKR